MSTATAAADAVNSRRSSAEQLTRDAMAVLVNNESGPHRLNAFISFDYEAAVAQAQRVDAEIAEGSRLPLAGVCIGVKDNIATLGLPTTCGSRMLARYRSPYEATVVQRLRAAGAVIAGKTNLDEFAMGSSTEHSAFGATLNPHDRDRVPGGSSGGSAAAVAAGLVHAALGSDTGGSVRQPAALCGVYGLRPTWGSVSRYGLAAFASSLDSVGILARTAEDTAMILRVIRGPDERDATSHVPMRRVSPEVRTVGVPREYLELATPAVRDRIDAAIATMRAHDIEVHELSLPSTRYALPAYIILAAVEASSNLARYDGVRFGERGTSAARDVPAASRAALGTEARRRILLGTFAGSADLRDDFLAGAMRARQRVTRELHAALDVVDVLFGPTTPTPAFRVGERLEDPAAMFTSDALTVPASLAGLPALSMPSGDVDGLPVGAQLIGPAQGEDRLLTFAAALAEWLR